MDGCNSWGLPQYSAMLAAFSALGYTIVSYGTASPTERHLILRHDVDLSLEHAVRLAECEAESKAQSTFFVLLDTDNYNPFSMASKALLRRIGELGHSIGLHFDPRPFVDSIDNLEANIDGQCRVLEDCTGLTVEAFSWHRPPQSFIGTEKFIKGRLNAYARFFTQDIGYCSDSHGAWRFGHPMQHSSVRNGKALQLLCHPIWWTGIPASPFEKIEAVLWGKHVYLESHVAQNSAPFRKGLVERYQSILAPPG